MSSYNNFQSDNQKYTSNRNNHNPEFNSTVSAKGKKEEDSFLKNIKKYVYFLSWARFYPDLFLDMITPKTGGIRLDLDQRVYLRALFRFLSVYGVFPRGYGKTFKEVLGMYLTAIFFPDIEIAMSAQTRENAAKLIKEKHREIVKFYPLIKNEIIKESFSKDSVEIVFTSGGRIDILANQQSSKGARRKRLNIEEAALLNNALFEDVLEPIPNIPRRTIGKEAVVNPEELNGQINFFTTSGFRGSDEFERNLRMVDEMAELKGRFVIGSDWQLACEYGRGETKSQILEKKDRLSPISFAMNYGSKWVGASDNALVNINKLLALRTLVKPETEPVKNGEYYVSMDIARSLNSGNNQSSIAVLRVIRSTKNNRIKKVRLVNLIYVPNFLNFTAQAIELKRIKYRYNARVAIIDENGLGSGIRDELLKEQTDPLTGEMYPCWDTINTDHTPDNKDDADKCLFALHSQGINNEIIVNFIDMVESSKLELLMKHDSSYELEDKDYINNVVAPMMQTDFLIEEISNLKLKHLQNGKLSIEQLTKRVDKDRYSATVYGLYYIMQYENKIEEKSKPINISQLFSTYKKPIIYK